jgi:hypothetical protein
MAKPQPKSTTNPASTPAAPPPTAPSTSSDQAAANQPQPDQAQSKAKPKVSLKQRLSQIPLSTLSIGVFLFFVILIGQLVLFVTFNQRVQQIQEQSLIELSQIDNQDQLADQVAQHDQSIVQLQAAFPDEQGLINFVDLMNRHLDTFPEAQLEFDSNEPIRINDTSIPFLPLTIRAKVTPDRFVQLLDYLAHSPYLFAPGEVRISIDQGLDQPVLVVIKAQLYVSTTI